MAQRGPAVGRNRGQREMCRRRGTAPLPPVLETPGEDTKLRIHKELPHGAQRSRTVKTTSRPSQIPHQAADRPPSLSDPSRQGDDGSCRDWLTVCRELRETVIPTSPGFAAGTARDARRDTLLGEYRQMLLARVLDDAHVNLEALTGLLCECSDRCGVDLARTPVGADLLSRLQQSCAVLEQLDPYRDGKTELKWWLALNQFYVDGLGLADRLLGVSRRAPGRPWMRPQRRIEVLGLSLPGLAQAGFLSLETAIPDLMRVNPFDTYVPTLLYLLAHHLFPSKRFSWHDLLGSTLGWIWRGGFGRMRGLKGEVIRFEGLENLHSEELFSTVTRRTRHNVIIAGSHRLGYLDLPLFFEPLRRVRFGVWSNNAFYGPALEKKIARDPLSIPVRGNHAPPLKACMARTAELLIDARVPVFIMVDGGQPPMFYGYQMRVKRGLRLAVNKTLERSRGTGRRTYVLPMTLNDPVGFVQGRQEVIRVAFHAPVLVEHAHAVQPPAVEGRHAPAGDASESGDPLLNYLEALFLTHTSNAEHGLPRPRVVEAVRRRLINKSREPLLKRPFQTTLADLARQAADGVACLPP